MLRSVEITTELAGSFQGEGFHSLHWQKKLELSLDCFICERTGRTTLFQHGEEQATCSSDRERPQHPIAARIASFDVTAERERLALRSIVDYWWAPFHDIKRAQPASALTDAPWVRLYGGYYCPQSQLPGSFSVQTNMVRPVRQTCDHCAQPLSISALSPSVRLLT
ncbi:hypothetical protein ABZ312_40970 [Streptomyces sp. NPDC006207]